MILCVGHGVCGNVNCRCDNTLKGLGTNVMAVIFISFLQLWTPLLVEVFPGSLLC